jgi:hypothetical protein
MPEENAMRTRNPHHVLLVAALMALAAPRAGAPAEPNAAATAMDSERDGQHDFDFYFGRWKIHNRRLKPPLPGSTQWEEFEATSVAKPIWGGLANMDEYEGTSATWGHLQGMTVRLYEPKSHEWRLYWANPKGAIIDIPVIGKFKNGRGEFLDQENFQGRTIWVRYTWSDITPNTCHWEQAFSWDNGKTWETNWIMDSVRDQ